MRLASAVLCAAVLASAPAALAGNLVVNGGFENTDKAGVPENWAGRAWAVNVDGEVTTVPGGVQGRCLRIKVGPGKTVYGAFSRAIEVSELKAQSLLVSCSYRTEGDPAAQAMLVSYSEDFMRAQWDTRPLSSEARALRPSGRWTTYTWNAELAPGAKQVVVVLQLLTGGTLFVDNMVVSPSPGDVTVAAKDLGLVASLPSARKALLQVSNSARAPIKASLTLTLRKPDGSTQEVRRQDLDLPGGETKELDIRYDADGSQSHVAQLLVSDRESGETVLYQEYRVPALIDAHLVSPAFRGTIMTSFDVPQVKVEGRLFAVPGVTDRVKLRARLVGTGATADEASGITRLADGAFSLQLPAEGMLIRDHEVQIEAIEGDSAVGEVSLPIRRVRPSGGEVTFDETGRLILNGRRAFPLGIYWVMTTQDLQAVHDAGFNTVVVPSARASWVLAEAAAAKGMGVVVASPEARREFWELRQEKFGEHPSIIGWETTQRPDAKTIPPEMMTVLYNIITEVSPNHPLITTLSYPDTFRSYAETTDVLQVWDMPVPRMPIAHTAGLIDAARAAVDGRKPVWAVIQATGQSWAVDKSLDPKTEGRLPTVEEVRAMAYLALVHGADGLMFYAYNLMQSPQERSYRIADDAPALWKGLSALNKELQALTDMACDPTFERIELLPAGDGLVHLARWRTQERDVLIAVNTSDVTTVATVSVPDSPAQTLQRVFDEKTLKASQPGNFTISFTPYASYVYDILS